MEKKRVALVLSGGVSLGSYIAGALDELLRALALSGAYEIDVITGASAGATTAALIAHGLLYRGGDTALHDVWVKQIDMHDLLDPCISPDEPFSLLSNRRLTDVARHVLSWCTKWGEPRRSPLCAERLIVAMTIANIEGVSYRSRVRMPTGDKEESFLQVRHAEQEVFYLSDQIRPDDAIWQRIGDVALASAALPGVFPPVPLRRCATNPDHYIQQPEFAGEAEFLYCDGGTFNNLPIDLAWHYARQSPGASSAERVIIIVDPSRDPVRPLNPLPPRQRALYRNPLIYFGSLISAVHTESSAVQFDREVVLPAVTSGRDSDLRGALPGVDRADVELLNNVALVLPLENAPRLYGSHLGYALAAFLDERLREHDFRRGAADARRVGRDLLELPEVTGRPDGFYDPDADPNLVVDMRSYAGLDTIVSTGDPRRTVRQCFESDLRARMHALIDRVPLPWPRWVWLYGWLVRLLARWLIWRKVREALPGLW
ncbi:MAG: patatin-like phospholipase family protein [Roseiflexus sp.]|nr:patatin-like phospholipase family protein [Roseiflexus sp.]